MAWLPIWRSLLERPNFSETWTASCGWGRSPSGDFWRKEFRFLLVRAQAALFHRKCPGFHRHTVIQGGTTKQTSQYIPALCSGMARGILAAVRRLQTDDLQNAIPERGSERAVLNELLLSSDWSVRAAWHWRKPEHINMLEGRAFLEWLQSLCRGRQGSRAFALVDSRVTLGSTAKGRSSSDGLTMLLRQGAALQLAGGLYPRAGFAPTRLNVADDPTRDVPLRFRDHERPSWLSDPVALECVLATSPGKGCLVNWVRLVAGVLPAAAWPVLSEGSSRLTRSELPLPLSMRRREPAATGEAPLLTQPLALAERTPGLPLPYPARGRGRTQVALREPAGTGGAIARLPPRRRLGGLARR